MNTGILKHLFFLAIFLHGIHSTCIAQKPLLEEYSNKLLFNFHTNNPDSNLCNFIKKHISAVYCQPKSKTDTVNGWSTKDKHTDMIYPPIQSTHSLFFSKHPILKEKFSVGKIEIDATEVFKDRIEIGELSPYLYFSEKQDAINAYTKLIDTLTKISPLKRFTNYKDTKKAEFTDNSIKSKSAFGVQLILTRDSINENSPFYIRFIPHNDLYK